MEKIICTNCGTENPDSLKYCTNCGYALPKKEEPVVEAAPVEAYDTNTLTAKLNKSKGLIGAVLGIALFVLFIFAIKHIISGGSLVNKIKNSAVNKTMTIIAAEVNKTCPMMVDQYTRLDNVTAMPDQVLQYNFTLMGIDKAQFQAEEVKENIRASLISTIKTNPQMQILRTYKATFVYNYCDIKGESIFKIAVTPDMYEN